MTLDDKLKHCLKDFGAELLNPEARGTLDSAAEDIKQVFADEDEFEVANITFAEAGKYTLKFRKPGNLLYGKEWYDRFTEELDSGLKLPFVMDKWVRICAQVAAGVKK